MQGSCLWEADLVSSLGRLHAVLPANVMQKIQTKNNF